MWLYRAANVGQVGRLIRYAVVIWRPATPIYGAIKSTMLLSVRPFVCRHFRK